MRTPLPMLLGVLALVLHGGLLTADDSLDDNQCVTCHGEADIWEDDTQHLYIPPAALADDIHWQKGLRCHDCHGGDPTTFDLRQAHATEDGFRKVDSPADIPQFCGHCHSDADYMGKHAPNAPLDLVERFLSSVHGKYQPDGPDAKPVTCNSCHPVHQMRAADDPLAAVHASRLNETCGACHEEPARQLLTDVHGAPDAAKPLDCKLCHGEVHAMLAVGDERSPVFVNNQVATCGECHQQAYQEYRASVHGHGLEHSGLLTTAVCSSCHGAHGVHPSADARSPLHVKRVGHTCAQCHRFIEERLAESVHARGNGLGDIAEKTSPGGASRRNPTCTDCHEGHDRPNPRSVRFRLELSHSCGNCHEVLSHAYAMSLHGQLTQLGYGPAAKCSDCHGAHDILPVSDPQSRVSGENRLATCRSCHAGAGQSFCNFLPHADHHDGKRYPVLRFVFLAMELLLYSVFCFFGVHTALWFVRSLIDTARHGRPQRPVPGGEAYVRFEPVHRATHLIVIISFLGLALTGLPLKYSAQPWAQSLARWLGGFDSTGLWHHIFGIVTVSYLVVHVVWLTGTAFRRVRRGAKAVGLVLGPDSPVPNPRDFRDMAAMFRWFFGRGGKPVFERWTYWEKFDYWAVFWGVAIIGTTGFMLWLPHLFTRFLPGEALNVAKIIHSEEALLATGFIFAIHFFNTHFRPEKFPMDMCVLNGLVSEEELREERPEYYDRLEREGKLDALRRTVPTRRTLAMIGVGGAVALAIGLALLVGMVSAFVWR